MTLSIPSVAMLLEWVSIATISARAVIRGPGRTGATAEENGAERTGIIIG